MFSTGKDPRCHKVWSVESSAVGQKRVKYKFVRKIVLQCRYLCSKGSCIFGFTSSLFGALDSHHVRRLGHQERLAETPRRVSRASQIDPIMFCALFAGSFLSAPGKNVKRAASMSMAAKDPQKSRKDRRDDSVMATNNSSIVSKRSVERLYYPEPHFYRYFVKKPLRRAPLINRK